MGLVLLAWALLQGGIWPAWYRELVDQLPRPLQIPLQSGVWPVWQREIIYPKNYHQLRLIRYVMEHTGPDDAVLDAFNGWGFFRPHAYYYWWLNQHSLKLMGRQQLQLDLLQILEHRPPKLILFNPLNPIDPIAGYFSPALRREIYRNYHPTEMTVILQRNGP